MRHTTNTLAAVVILLASISHTQAGDMTDEQMLKRAVEVIAKEDASAKVTPVQSKNLHLGTWALMNPLPEYRLFCARLNPGKEIAAPNRRFLAVKRTGQVIESVDGAKFAQLLTAEDKAKWKDADYRNAAILWVHVMSKANEDGWKVLEKPEDFTKCHRARQMQPLMGASKAARVQRFKTPIRDPLVPSVSILLTTTQKREQREASRGSRGWQ